MKTVFSNLELAHVWAQQNQEHGKGSNMFFNGPKIYSYGYHFCIANFIKPTVVLYNSNRYSNSTAKQQSYVIRAIHSAKVFSVPYVDTRFDFDSFDSYHYKNLTYYKNQVIDCLAKAAKATTSTDWLVSQAKMYKGQYLDYIQAFELSDKEDINSIVCETPELLAKIVSQLNRVRLKEEEERLVKEAKNQEFITVYLPRWLNGETVPIPSGCGKAYLRRMDSIVETSKGARVSLTTAKILFDMIKAGKDVKGFDVDGYTVISMNGVLKIGCHEIERNEIDRLAKNLNWI